MFGELATVAGRDAARTIQELATTPITDPLTGLFNRDYADALIEQHFAMFKRLGLRFAVTRVDIDGLDEVNADYGTTTGDEAIRFVASILSNNTRKMDTIARFAGDDFVIVSHVGPDVDASEIGERSLRLVRGSQLASASEEIVPLTVSVGEALAHDDDLTPRSVIERATAALEADPRGRRRRLQLRVVTGASSGSDPQHAGPLRRDPLTDRWTALAPGRTRRPHDDAESASADPASPVPGTPAAAPACPFCEGNEQLTPPEVDAVRPEGVRPTGPDGPCAWSPTSSPCSPAVTRWSCTPRRTMCRSPTWNRLLPRRYSTRGGGGLPRTARPEPPRSRSSSIRGSAPGPRSRTRTRRCSPRRSCLRCYATRHGSSPSTHASQGTCPWCESLASARAATRGLLVDGAIVAWTPEARPLAVRGAPGAGGSTSPPSQAPTPQRPPPCCSAVSRPFAWPRTTLR